MPWPLPLRPTLLLLLSGLEALSIPQNLSCCCYPCHLFCHLKFINTATNVILIIVIVFYFLDIFLCNVFGTLQRFWRSRFALVRWWDIFLFLFSAIEHVVFAVVITTFMLFIPRGAFSLFFILLPALVERGWFEGLVGHFCSGLLALMFALWVINFLLLIFLLVTLSRSESIISPAWVTSAAVLVPFRIQCVSFMLKKLTRYYSNTCITAN